MNTKTNKSIVKAPMTVLTALLLIIAFLTGLVGCGKLKLVEKTELGLKFAIPDDFERSYDYGFDIEYKGEETAFYVDLIPYSAYELEYGAGIETCTKAVMEAMEFSAMNITYTQNNTAQFDAWASDSAGSESYYNYIVILLSQRGIFAVRYVCAGTEKAMKKHTENFAEMASHLGVLDP